MKKKHNFLTKRPFAHRGYHSSLVNYKKIPENSLDAFRQAIEKNYSIEMDIHLTRDFKIVVFHDFFLGRLTTKTGFVFNKNLDYIKEAKLSNNQTIPTIEEAFNLINGRVPVLLEIKYSKHIRKNLELFSKILAEKLESYSGPLAIMSFSTDLIKFMRRKNLFTRFPLGLTTCFPKVESLNDKIKNNKIENEIISNKLQFISQNWRGIDNSRIEKLKKLDIAILSWTITSRDIEKSLKGLVDNITFENYEAGSMK
ncbi:glycerophosphodiester phosphodiesterase family protein [Paracoccaceae bacterium]|nr:glycerophosphodiester phosphodiesterase family protein [Paracoccaceae bacterium]